jgi:hypothetical protein
LNFDKFGFQPKKTYNPPNLKTLDKINPNQAKALLTGIIDGDGSISKNGRIQLCSHKTWKSYLEKLIKTAYPFALTSHGFEKNNVIIRINGGLSVSTKIRREVETLNVPFLKRKWDRIPLIRT